MLDYTLLGLLTQQVEIERNQEAYDAFGGRPHKDLVVIETIPCRFWWWKEGGARSAAKEYATPERSIELTGGGLLLERDADVKAFDRVKNVLDEEGSLIVAGPFRVVSVTIWEEHLEAALMRP